MVIFDSNGRINTIRKLNPKLEKFLSIQFKIIYKYRSQWEIFDNTGKTKAKIIGKNMILKMS
ncbi:hypothetical protein HYD87_02985 [Mycoplasmopsis bovis]|nr:hypothetical protein [Mycoplasmopsis bovis]QQH36675.1 hypothetical protein HYD87_02985 [Mycoplasmopsis bovis]